MAAPVTVVRSCGVSVLSISRCISIAQPTIVVAPVTVMRRCGASTVARATTVIRRCGVSTMAGATTVVARATTGATTMDEDEIEIEKLEKQFEVLKSSLEKNVYSVLDIDILPIKKLENLFEQVVVVVRKLHSDNVDLRNRVQNLENQLKDYKTEFKAFKRTWESGAALRQLSIDFEEGLKVFMIEHMEPEDRSAYFENNNELIGGALVTMEYRDILLSSMRSNTPRLWNAVLKEYFDSDERNFWKFRETVADLELSGLMYKRTYDRKDMSFAILNELIDKADFRRAELKEIARAMARRIYPEVESEP